MLEWNDRPFHIRINLNKQKQLTSPCVFDGRFRVLCKSYVNLMQASRICWPN